MDIKVGWEPSIHPTIYLSIFLPISFSRRLEDSTGISVKNQSLNRQKYCVVNGINYDTTV